jgi:hypothetical protein
MKNQGQAPTQTIHTEDGVVAEELLPGSAAALEAAAPALPRTHHNARYRPSQIRDDLPPIPTAFVSTRPEYDVPDGAPADVADQLLAKYTDEPAFLEGEVARYTSELDGVVTKYEKATWVDVTSCLFAIHHKIDVRAKREADLKKLGGKVPDRAPVWVQVAQAAVSIPALLQSLRDNEPQQLRRWAGDKQKATELLQIKIHELATGVQTVSRVTGKHAVNGEHTGRDQDRRRLRELLERIATAKAWLLRLSSETEEDRLAAVCELLYKSPIPTQLTESNP